MALTPTIKVGHELIWLDAQALAKDEVKLDRESISEQCDGCGRDIMETGQLLRRGELRVRCAGCGETYAVVVREVA